MGFNVPNDKIMALIESIKYKNTYREQRSHCNYNHYTAVDNNVRLISNIVNWSGLSVNKAQLYGVECSRSYTL